MSSFFESNLEYLRNNHFHAYKHIIETRTEPKGELVPIGAATFDLKVFDKNDLPVLLYEKNPLIEKQRHFELLPADAAGVAVFVGVGLGYTPKAVLKERPNFRNMVILEPDTGIFLRALHTCDLSDILSDPRVVVAIGEDLDTESAIGKIQRAVTMEDAFILHQQKSFDLYPELYKRVRDEVFSLINAYNAGGATVRKHGHDMFDNRMQMLKMIHHHYKLEDLRGLFKGVPAVMVASGPSLDKNIHLLKELKNRAVIISVDTAFPALLKNGCMPDFITSIDYKTIIYEKMASCAPEGKYVSMIGPVYQSRKVASVFPCKHRFLSFPEKNIDKWLNRLIGGKMALSSGGTVAHMNILAAVLLGCSPIVFVGQDLAYTDNKDHSDNVVLAGEHWKHKMEQGRDIVWMKPNYGDKPLPAMRTWQSHREFFESFIEHNPAHYINATEGGVYIEGTELMTLEEVIHRYCGKEYTVTGVFNRFLEGAGRIEKDRLAPELEKMLETIPDIERKIKKADMLGKDAVKVVRKKRYESFEQMPVKTRKKIQEIDRIQDSIDAHSLIWGILDEITSEALQDDERLKHDIDRVDNRGQGYVKWFAKNIERLDRVNQVRRDVLARLKESVSQVLDHWEKEKELSDKNDRIGLCRLYYQAGLYVLMKPILESFSKEGGHTAETWFYKGVLSLHHTQYREAETCFENAVQEDPSFEQKIEKVKQDIGDEYLEYFTYEAEWQREKTGRRMLVKGLTLSPEHSGLIEALNRLCEKHMHEADQYMEKADIGEARSMLEEWHKVLEDEQIARKVEKSVLSGFYVQYCKMSIEAEQYDTAISSLVQAVSLDVRSAFYWESIGDKLYKEQAYTDALTAYETCSTHLPEKYEILQKIAECYFALGEMNASKESFRQYRERCFSTDETIPYDSCIREGERVHLKGFADEAVLWYKKAVELDSARPVAWHNLGKAFQDQGDLNDAGKFYQNAIEADPKFYKSYYNIAQLYQAKGDLDSAVRYYQKTIEIKPDFYFAHNNIGVIFKTRKNYDQALSFFNQALAYNPGYISAIFNSAVIYGERRDHENAVQYLQLALKQEPENDHVLATLVSQFRQTCRWRDMEPVLEKLKSITRQKLQQNLKPGEYPFNALVNHSDPMIHFQIAEQYSRWISRNVSGLYPLAKTSRQRSPDARITIGYLSSDFRDHPLGHIMSGLLTFHDPETFRVICYSADHEIGDPYTQRIMQSCGKFVDIGNRPEANAAEMIREDKVDILMDMTGYTKNSKIGVSANKPAPVQVGFLGYLGTTGSEFIDYIVTDQTATPPECRNHYSEAFAFMPDCYQAIDYSNFPTGRVFTRHDFHLPENAVVFCSFNQTYKIDPKFFQLCMNILQQVPGSVLWLWKTGPEMKKNLQYTAEHDYNVNPDRLVFSDKLPLSDHLQRLKLADIALDPIIYNGGATTNNSLWAGLPVVALKGNSFTTRMAASTVKACGLDELAVDSLEDYKNTAVELAVSPDLLEKLKQKAGVARQESPVFNGALYMKNLERLFVKMINKYETGEKASEIEPE